MTMEPLVSVIIPTYNHAEFLRQALRSVCEQSFTNWEAIVVNNYSEDDTVAVVESFGDERIRLENFHNHGVIAASRNRGIALARGRYLAFLDSDDVWYPDKLTKCMRCFEDGVDLVAHGLHTIGGGDRDIYCGPAARATFDALLDNFNCITPSATVVRKDVAVSVGCFPEDESYVTAEDYYFSLKLAQAGVGMRFLREILGGYRVHEGNMSVASLRQMHASLNVFKAFLPEIDSAGFGLWLRIRKRYCMAYYGVARSMQRRRNFPSAWSPLFRAMYYNPLFIKNYFALLYNLSGWFQFPKK